MKFKKRAAAAVALTAVMACGVLAGCNGLTTTNAKKDYEQVVAEVNIAQSPDFKEGGKFAAYAPAITASEITKRDLVSLFASQGGSLVNNGYSYAQVFDTICNTLINRQVYVQYAKAYYLASGGYTVEGYTAAVEAAPTADASGKGYSAEKKALEKEIAGLGYFLDDEEEAKALYDLKVSVNEALDSQEESIIAAESDEAESAETPRTTPTGVNTEDEDYCAESYEIYTGTGTRHAADCGEYELVENSTVTTRRKAYTSFLSNLRSYALLFDGEDTSEIENLVYYSMEVKNAYESALLQKLNQSFEDEAEAIFGGGDWVQTQYKAKLQSQIDGYREDPDSFETALDGMSDTSFLLAAPKEGYGFVINILLPFSEGNSQELDDAAVDKGDLNGNKFSQRADILKKVKATDQRGTWFTGEEDYSFKVETGTAAYAGTLGNEADRQYLFFEDCLNADGTGKYEPLKNYYGQYTYNGKVTEKTEGGKTTYTLTPKKIDIDGFIGEMEGYLNYALGEGKASGTPVEDYYDRTAEDYYTKKADGSTDWSKVDYSTFVYYKGKVTLDGYSANDLFVEGTDVNKAFSVINELSFAYNTDTAGLNSYLGYAVTPAKTDFVSEFEYAAQEACRGGAGTYVVAPSDYGWHIIYCTFSFTAANEAAFTYIPADVEKEGTFSNLFYESVKAQSLSNYASTKQTQIINSYADTCSTKYEDRYADLSNLG